MGRLHEVLAVEGSLKSTSDKVLHEAANTFINKKGHFLGQYREYSALLEGGIKYEPEVKIMETTVKDKLDYVSEHFARAIDCIFQKEVTNTKAVADIIIGGTVMAKAVPATFLLTLEGKLKELRCVYDAIPTLDPGKEWIKDKTNDNVYISTESPQIKTQKCTEALVLYPATDKHPAQVDKITVDKAIGQWKQINSSGALTTSDKSYLLGRTDTLIRAVKQARMRANEQEVDSNLRIADNILEFLSK